MNNALWTIETITFGITAIGAAFGIATYIVHVVRWQLKKHRLITYLRVAKSTGRDRGQRSALNITRELGLTPDEILNLSYWSSKVQRRVKTDADNFADKLLFEYGDSDDKA